MMKLQVGRLSIAVAGNRFDFGPSIDRGKSAYARYVEIWLPKLSIVLEWKT
jgi:hypothetical protein